MWLTKTFQHKCARMSCIEQLLRIVHLQEVGHILRPKNKPMNHAQERRVPQYLADLQNGNAQLQETIIENLNEFDPDENSGHDFTSTCK